MGIGLAAGTGLALVAMKGVGSLLYGLQPNDVSTLAGAILLLVVVATAASYVPARRATRVDPVTALRAE
jgi:putative ABC transport system permease protein